MNLELILFLRFLERSVGWGGREGEREREKIKPYKLIIIKLPT